MENYAMQVLIVSSDREIADTGYQDNIYPVSSTAFLSEVERVRSLS